ncbi:MAG: ABC transporter permease [Cyclobacteriaceae bacterium]|nr:ABC transporter permease [Cyclobacteriaceae bacterium]
MRKEFTLELRRKSVFSGLAIYLFSTVFIYYISFNLRQDLISPIVWSALFWVTLLFTSVNTVAKSFIGEKKGEQVYYYSIASPLAIIISKIVYNFLLCLLLALAGFILFIVFFSNPVQDLPIFALTTTLTCLGFATSLTLLSAIASKADNSHILMAILSLPIIVGILLLAIRITKNCIDGLDRSVSIDELLSLMAINLLVTAVSYLLFPYIWRS